MILSVPPNVRLVAVTKGRATQEIEALIHQGYIWFGENRIQEIKQKWPTLREKYPHIKLQFIGQLQSNKAMDAVTLCDSIVSLDRPSLVYSVAKALLKHPKSIELLIEVNLGNEDQKGGLPIDQLPAVLQLCTHEGLSIQGLMTIPPVNKNSVPYFSALKELCKKHHLPECSMGMSDDYDRAIACGSTQVRVGRALFKS